MFYDDNSKLVKKLMPKKENHLIDTGILYFSYSKLEKRIGACLQDFTIAFWDLSDGFNFEKFFPGNVDVLQIFIRYIEYCGRWCTID